MSGALTIVNGLPRMTPVTASMPSIYDQSVTIVASGGNGTTTLNSPVTSGTSITLPSSGTYTIVSGVTDLTVYLSGQRLEYLLDWTAVGVGPSYTAISLNFDISTRDRLDFRKERDA